MESSRCRAFVRAVALGSLTAAAKSLGYTTSGVSQLINAFEEDLGIPLLIRNRKGVVPTEEGKLIYQAANAFLAREDEIYQLAAQIKGITLGKLTIASYASISARILPGLLKNFLDKYPEISVRIVEGSKIQIDEWLKSGYADIAFVSKFRNRSYNSIPFMDDEIHVLLPADHKYAGNESIEITQLEDENFVMTCSGEDTDVLEIFQKHNASINIRYTTTENESTVNLVEAGLGVTALNTLATSESKTVVKLPFNPPEIITYVIATPAHINQTPAVKKMIEFATEYLKQYTEDISE